LLAAGYAASCGEPKTARPGDALLIWNRRGVQEQIADRFEAAGGTVLVAEEGYVRRDRFYALGLRYHNGGGLELVNDPARVALLSVELQPWRDGGDYVLVCPNRFIGPARALMPPRWADETAARLRKLTGREVRVRHHPGRMKDGLVNGRSLAEDLAKAWLCVVWWSTAGIAALLAGVPVRYCAPWWIAAAAARCGLENLQELPPFDGREKALARIANAQFSPAEIAAGVPFMGLAG
jgi:hypothetical protein